nr:inositol monophosphatase family protein [Propionicimonas sp.]
MIASAELMDIARCAALSAGKVALQGFRNHNVEIEEKADFHDIVTAYDRKAEAEVRTVIDARLPGSRILGEEGGFSGDGEVTWYVDPIDGTANFARGIALWAVVVAAAVDGEVVAGVVYDPVAEQLFEADERGARLNGRPLLARGCTVPEQATVIASFPLPRDLVHYSAEALAAYAQLELGYSAVRDLGSSAISLCHVAAGWADATFAFEANPWDVAAPAFILKQAGGVYRTYGEGRQLPSVSDHLNRHYFGTVAGADFALIDQIMRFQSRRPVNATVPDPT